MDYILFDRSIFHGSKFEILAQSNILKLVTDCKIRIYFTPGFIEETLQYGVNTERRKDLDPQLKFLFQLNSTHWFRHAEDIVDSELGLRHLDQFYYLLHDEQIALIKNGSIEFTNSEFSETAFEDVRGDVAERNQINAALRNDLLEFRKSTPPVKYDFDGFFESWVEFVIEKGLMSHHTNSEGFLRRWREFRIDCRFTEQYLRCWLSTVFLPVTDHKMPIKKTDMSDATQLAYLTWTDVMVSDDMGFMKKCYELLYSKSKKRILSLPDFLNYLETGASLSDQ